MFVGIEFQFYWLMSKPLATSQKTTGCYLLACDVVDAAAALADAVNNDPRERHDHDTRKRCREHASHYNGNGVPNRVSMPDAVTVLGELIGPGDRLNGADLKLGGNCSVKHNDKYCAGRT